MARILLPVYCLLLSLGACAQTAKTTEAQWLQSISQHALHNAPTRYGKAPAGLALYFSQAGTISVPYLVYVPKGYDPAQPSKLVVFLHGASLATDSFQYKNPEMAHEPIFSIGDVYNALVVFPFARTDFKWSGGQTDAFENIFRIISQVAENYHVDTKHIYIGGQSMGGKATWWFVNHKPEVFAGFYTFSAMPSEDAKFQNITTSKPLYALHAKDDQMIPFSEADAIYQKHRSKAPGWHFNAVPTGGHKFIYGKDGERLVRELFAGLLR
jgi:poly(3-hydroxybutyrate) depolymerase